MINDPTHRQDHSRGGAEATVRLSVRVDRTLADDVAAVVEAEGASSKSAVIRSALQLYCRRSPAHTSVEAHPAVPLDRRLEQCFNLALGLAVIHRSTSLDWQATVEAAAYHLLAAHPHYWSDSQRGTEDA